MVKPAEAYFNGKKVKPIWSEGKFSFEDKNTNFVFTNSAKKEPSTSLKEKLQAVPVTFLFGL